MPSHNVTAQSQMRQWLGNFLRHSHASIQSLCIEEGYFVPEYCQQGQGLQLITHHNECDLVRRDQLLCEIAVN